MEKTFDKNQTLGALIATQMIKKNITSIKDIPDDVLCLVIKDSYWTNSIPIKLFIRMLELLEIDFKKAECAICNTLDILMKAKEAKPKTSMIFGPPNDLWENREAIGKYVARLRELMTTRNEDKILSKEKIEAEAKRRFYNEDGDTSVAAAGMLHGFWIGAEWAEKEIEPFIDAVYEGAAAWEQEYKDCRALLSELVAVKELKDTEGKTADYLQRQPIAWEKAKEFLSTYQHDVY